MSAADDLPESTAGYRIGAVSRITGLSQHTIRIWERRYGAVSPRRTPGHDRVYQAGDVRRLTLLGRLTRLGHSIGTIANLPDNELESLAARYETQPGTRSGLEPPANSILSLDGVRERFLERIARLDVAEAEALIARLVATLEPQDLLLGFFSDLFEEIGEQWESGHLSVAQEHAASALIRNQLAVLMRSLSRNGSGPLAIAGTPAGERHEFGALLAALVAAQNQWRVIYLGPDLPADEWVSAAAERRAQAILLSWVSADPVSTRAELVRIREGLPLSVPILLGGRAGRQWRDAPPGITLIENLDGLHDYLRQARPGRPGAAPGAEPPPR